MTASFTQDTFDRAFVRAVEYLLKENIVTSKKWFSDRFDLLPQTLSFILAGTRGVPHAKRENIKRILTKELRVRRQFLETNSGAIVNESINSIPKGFPEIDEIISKLEDCEKENDLLRNTLTDKDLLIKTQQELIESLKRKN